MSVQEIGLIARALKSKGVTSLKLSGGEPTTRGDLSEIVLAAAYEGLKPIVITNGIRFRGDLLANMALARAEFKFSIHRDTEANDDVLKVSSFTEILANMRAVRRCSIPFSINTVIVPQNISIMAPMASFAFDMGARKISFIPVVRRGRAATKEIYSFSTHELVEVRRYVAHLAGRFLGRLTVRCIDIRHHDYWIVENDGSLWVERAREDQDLHICGKNELTAECQYARKEFSDG